jgi:lactate permease
MRAYAPYIVIIAVFAIAQIGFVKNALESVTKEFNWPALHVLNSKGKPPTSLTFKFNWLSAAGTLLLISGFLTMPILRIGLLRGSFAEMRVHGPGAARVRR